MADSHPNSRQNDQHLPDYWKHGKGSALIRWGEAGDFDRCVTHIRKYLPDGDKAERACAQWHHDVTGAWPGHAATEQKPH